jgi:drug/metabolite transporter superfamily protein YnfA
VTFGAVLLIVGGFLLGGSWSIWRSDTRDGRRTTGQVIAAVILLLCALLATAAGILRLV